MKYYVFSFLFIVKFLGDCFEIYYLDLSALFSSIFYGFQFVFIDAFDSCYVF